MNKAELIDALTARLGDKKAATTALDAVLDEIQRTVAKGGKISLAGFGVFEKRARAARTARNPRTGEAVRVKKTNVPAFRPGQGFKDVVTGKKKIAAPKKTTKKATTARKATTSAVSRSAAKSTAKKASTKKVAAKKAPATRKTAAKVTRKTATKSVTRKATPTRATAKRATTRKTTARKAPTKSTRRSR